MDSDKPELPRIDSPIHQLRQIDEAVSDTGTGMLIVFGIKELSKALEGLSAEVIECWIRDLLKKPEQTMGARVENGLPVLPVVAFVENEVAHQLNKLEPDLKPEVVEE